MAKQLPHPAKKPAVKAGTVTAKWWQFTLSALAGAIITLITVVLAIADVKHDAEAGAALIPRVHALEIHNAMTNERWSALNRRMDKQDRMLEKLAK